MGFIDTDAFKIAPPHLQVRMVEAESRADAAWLAFDEALSTRRYDNFGRLHVAATPISKAGVNDYLGKEIPGWQKLGLDPSRVYKMLRDPEEMRKAASTFNNLPMLRDHPTEQERAAVTADGHLPHLVIGSTGTDSKFDYPYLWNTFAIWARHNGIEHVEDDSKRALSAGYSYEPDMTPGTFEGQRYDGVMRNLKGNHLVICREGRAGPDIVIGDSTENLHMAKATLTPAGKMAYDVARVRLAPLLATDARLDISPAFTSFSFNKLDGPRAPLAKIVKGSLRPGISTTLAMDNVAAGLRALLEALGGDSPEGTDATPPELDPAAGGAPAGLPDAGGAPPPADMDDGGGAPPDMAGGAPAAPPAAGGAEGSPGKALRDFLKGILTPEQMQQLEALVGNLDKGAGAEAGAPPAPGEPPKHEGEPPKPEAKPDMGGGGVPPKKDGAPPAAAPPKKVGAQDAPPSFTGKPRIGGAKDDDTMTQPTAMDALIRKAISDNDSRHAAIAAARDLVRPFVGDIAKSVVCDSANAVLKTALTMRGYDSKVLDQINETPALELLVRNLPRAAEARRASEPSVAQDAASPYSLSKMFPGLTDRVSVG